MEYLNGASNGEALYNNGGLHILRHSPYTKTSSLPWFDLKMFYVHVSNFHVDAKTPDSLAVTHIPLNPNTLLEVNGCRMKNSCNGVNSILRRDRVDKKSEEATFVSTDTIRMTGSVKFEVFDEEELILYGVLEMSNSSNGVTTESKNSVKRWSMTCEQGTGSGMLFNKGDSPTIEVYVAGSFAGSPIILTKSLQISSRKKNNKVSLLCAIPENEATQGPKGDNFGNNFQVNGFYNNKIEHDDEEYEEQMYWRRPEYMDGGEELDGELSWFNAGVRVGVGIGLGICVSVGVGVGLLVQSYQATARNFRRRLV